MRFEFRGQQKDTPNNWIYGSLIGDDIIYDTECHRVDTNSVGFSSGLHDCFGIKIFENDIILNLKTNQYYEVAFDGTDFWLKRASAPFNFMLLADADLDMVKVVGNSYKIEEE